MKCEVTAAKLNKYLLLTEQALEQAKITVELSEKDQKRAETYRDMAARYLKDARHFAVLEDRVTAFAAVNYAHGWLDAGAIAGLFDVKGQNKLFTVD